MINSRIALEILEWHTLRLPYPAANGMFHLGSCGNSCFLTLAGQQSWETETSHNPVEM